MAHFHDLREFFWAMLFKDYLEVSGVREGARIHWETPRKREMGKEEEDSEGWPLLTC